MTIQIQTVKVSAGAVEYTWPVTITERNGKDISGDAVRVSLGSYAAPATWVAPTVDTPQADHATRVVQLLINGATPAGSFYLWVKVTDSPEIVPRRAHLVVVA